MNATGLLDYVAPGAVRSDRFGHDLGPAATFLVNGSVLWFVLRPFQKGEVLMRAIWLCTRVDVVANLGVILSARWCFCSTRRSPTGSPVSRSAFMSSRRRSKSCVKRVRPFPSLPDVQTGGRTSRFTAKYSSNDLADILIEAVPMTKHDSLRLP